MDEAQDLPGNWLELLDGLLNKQEKSSNMWVFEDPFQVRTIKICRTRNEQISQVFYISLLCLEGCTPVFLPLHNRRTWDII